MSGIRTLTEIRLELRKLRYGLDFSFGPGFSTLRHQVADAVRALSELDPSRATSLPDDVPVDLSANDVRAQLLRIRGELEEHLMQVGKDPARVTCLAAALRQVSSSYTHLIISIARGDW